MNLRYLKHLILIFLLLQIKVFAQNYVFSPGKVFTANLDTNQLNFNGIRITNTGTTDLDFTWELILKDTLTDCEFDLCNSGICYNNLPQTGVMPAIPPGQAGFLKLHMFSGLTNGVNTIKYVLNNAALLSSDTLTFLITVGTATTILDLDKLNNTVFLYPNPANNETVLSFSLLQESTVAVNIINTVGQVVYTSSSVLIAGINTMQVDTKNYAPGIYNVVITSATGSVTKKLSVTK